MNYSFLKPVLPSLIVMAFGALAAPLNGQSQSHDPAPQRVRTLLTTGLPPRMNGKHLQVTLIAVHYGPGDASPPHTHACPAIVYVLDGTVRSEIKGQPLMTYQAGESFYEQPGGVHQISENASNSNSARFLALFVCDHDVPLSSDPPTSVSGGTR